MGMPRQPRLDGPGTLHHVMGRGIEGTKIFRTDADREDFLSRLAELCRKGYLLTYARASMALGADGQSEAGLARHGYGVVLFWP